MSNHLNNNAFSNIGLWVILKKQKLIGNNFVDWSRTFSKDELAVNASIKDWEAYKAALQRSLDVTYLMLGFM